MSFINNINSLSFIGDMFADIMTDNLRSICAFFDNIFYGIIPKLYELIFYIADVRIFSNENPVISGLMNRMYIILIIFMLFKLAFSILRFIINPDNSFEEGKGMGKVISNSIIALVVIALVPSIFNFAYTLQARLLRKNTIGNLVLGQQVGTTVNKDNNDNPSYLSEIESSAYDIQFMMYGAFYSVNYNNSSFSECDPNTDGNGPLVNVFGSVDMGTNTKCMDAIDKQIGNDSNIKETGVKLDDFFDTDESEKDTRDFSKLQVFSKWKVDDQYAINYIPVISTIVGVYLDFLLLSFAIDIATRALKLFFLELIAPISIIQFIDPNKSNYQNTLSNWASECIKTYLSLFLRIATIFLIIQMVRIISSQLFGGQMYSNIKDPDTFMNLFVYILLILGLFKFGKDLPNLIEPLLGIKTSGDLSLNPFKSLTSNPALMAGLGGILGFGSAALSNTLAIGSRVGRAKKSLHDNGGLKNMGREVADNIRGVGHSITNIPSNQQNKKLEREAAKNRYKAENTRLQSELARGKISRDEYLQGTRSAYDSLIKDRQNAKAEAIDNGVGHAVSDLNSSVSKFTRPVNEIASAVAGPVPAAVKGGVSGLKNGAKQNSFKGVVEAAGRARRYANDEREERISKLEMADTYSAYDKLMDSFNKYTGLRTKSYGVGQINQQVKDLGYQIDNLRNQLTQANFNLTNARTGLSGVQGLNIDLNQSNDRLYQQFTDGHGNVSTQYAQYQPIVQFVDSVNTVNRLTDEKVSIDKSIAQLQDIANNGGPGGPGGGPKPGGMPGGKKP